MLAELLGSEARVRVLALLLRDPDQAFYVREIVRLTCLHPRSVQRELERLTGIRLLLREPRGNQVFYRANRDHPILSDLRSLFLKTVALADPLRKALAKHRDIEIAFIHGSVAAGMDTPESDVDVLIIGKVKLSELAATLSDLERTLGREVNASVFSRAELAERYARQDPFITTVLRESMTFLISNREQLMEALA